MRVVIGIVNKFDELIISVHITNDVTIAGYYDCDLKCPVAVDFSGGYGDVYMPTAMLYTYDTEEWLYGQYAKDEARYSNNVYIKNLINKLVDNEVIEINNTQYDNKQLLMNYLQNIINYFYNINPNMRVGKLIVVADKVVHSLYSEVIEIMGIKDYSVITPIESYANYCYKDINESETFVLLSKNDTIKCTVCEIDTINNKCYTIVEEEINNLINENYSSNIYKILLKVYNDNNALEVNKDKLLALTDVYNRTILEKLTETNPVKIYYDFGQPPFVHTMVYEDVKHILEDVNEQIKNCIDEALKKYVIKTNKSTKNIQYIMCTDNVFNYSFVRNMLRENYNNVKYSIDAIVKGAVMYGVESVQLQYINYEDNTVQVSIKTNNKNITIDKKNNVCLFINREIINSIDVHVYVKNNDIGYDKIITLDVGDREKGTTRLKFSIVEDNNKWLLEVSDLGFNEIVKNKGYMQLFEL